MIRMRARLRGWRQGEKSAFGARVSRTERAGFSQSRALTAPGVETFSAGCKPAAFNIALWLKACGPAKRVPIAKQLGMEPQRRRAASTSRVGCAWGCVCDVRPTPPIAEAPVLSVDPLDGSSGGWNSRPGQGPRSGRGSHRGASKTCCCVLICCEGCSTCQPTSGGESR